MITDTVVALLQCYVLPQDARVIRLLRLHARPSARFALETAQNATGQRCTEQDR